MLPTSALVVAPLACLRLAWSCLEGDIGRVRRKQSGKVTADASGLNAEKVQAKQIIKDIIAKWMELKASDFFA